MVNSRAVFSTDLPSAAMKFYRSHRGKYRRFMCGVVGLLVDCARIEVSKHALAKENGPLKDTIDKWQARLKKVESVLMKYDKEITDKWLSEAEKDSREMAATDAGLGNRGFSKKLYDFLADKFSWRSWYVAVFNGNLKAPEQYKVTQCGGFSLINLHGKDIIVGSKEGKVSFNANEDNGKLNKMDDTMSIPSGFGVMRVKMSATKTFDIYIKKFPGSCPSRPAMFGVVNKIEGDLQLNGRDGGYAMQAKQYHNMFIMG